MSENRLRKGAWVFLWTLTVLAVGVSTARSLRSDSRPQLDPKAWGDDHVGKPVPEYATGDQCLFCHRVKIGPTWSANRHSLAIREFDSQSPACEALKQSTAKELTDEIQYVMGDQRRQRFLKSAAAYGHLEMLSVGWVPSVGAEKGKLVSTDRPRWEKDQFANSCAGCHTTAVDSKEKAFAALSLDCYVCHGSIPTEHANKPELAYLSPARKDDARVVTSICAQCHVRTGKSKSTGLPYPNNFVAGDNLFRDFEVDFSNDTLKKLSDADRHVLENVRDVVLSGNETVTCLSCHDVHGRSSQKHHLVSKSDYCLNCHNAQGPKKDLKSFSNHSQACGY